MSMGRLAEQFRADARQGRQAEWTAVEPPTWTLEVGGGRRVRYELRQDRVVRQDADGDKRATSEFALPPGVTASIALEETSTPRLSLVLRTADKPEGDGWPVRIAARLGSDSRSAPAASRSGLPSRTLEPGQRAGPSPFRQNGPTAAKEQP